MANFTAPSASLCSHLMPAVSNGILQGDFPLHFALPLLTVQIALVLLVTRSMAMAFKRIRQPRVLAEIIGGVLLGPTAMGRNQFYKNKVFPEQSIPLLDTVATMGLMFFIFMVGLELDIRALRKTGKNALLIGVAGIALPFAGAALVANLVRSSSISRGAPLAPLIVFMGTPLSISAFSVLVRIMAELKLLTTEVGKLAIPAAAVNDVAVWTFLAVGVAIAGPKHNPLTPIWVLLSGATFGVIMFTVVRMFMTIIAHRAARQEQGTEIYVCITLVGVLLSGFFSDAIGIHPLFGPFLFGLVTPKDNAFPKMITEKIEDFVTGLMLPLFFASSGLKTNLGVLHGAISLAFLALFMATAAIGKIGATFLFARLTGLPNRQALILGFLMNTKGLAVLIVLNIGRDLKVFTDETFAILVLTCLLTSFATTPTVSALCQIVRDSRAYDRCNVESIGRKDQLRILACAYENRQNVSVVNVVEASRGTKKSSLKLYTLRLMELSDRPSTTLMLKNAKDGEIHSHIDGIIAAFQASRQLSKVTVRPLTAISGVDNMHEDICNLAAEKRATFIILPYHEPAHGTAGMFELGFHKVNQKVLDHAPCSVGILVDRACAAGASMAIHPCFFSYKVVVLFLGGPDDREALVLGCRMADHPGVELKVVRFVADLKAAAEDGTTAAESNCNLASAGGAVSAASSPTRSDTEESEQEQKAAGSYMQRRFYWDEERERKLDEEAIEGLKESVGAAVCEQEEAGKSAAEAIRALTKPNNVNLFLVGRGRWHRRPLLGDHENDHVEESSKILGVVGQELLSAAAASGSAFFSSILVIQQHLAVPLAVIPTATKSPFGPSLV